MDGAAWYHKGTGIASNQGPGDDNEDDNEHQDVIRQKLLNYGYTWVDQIYDPSANAQQVTDAVNEGRSTINYTGHGWSGGWSSSSFSSSHVNALVNDNKLPFITSVACDNGMFEGRTCFGEAWLQATHNGEPTGAIGAYMSARSQSWDPPMCAQDEVIDLLVQDEKRTYGGLCFNGSCQMMDEYGSAGQTEFRAWTIFGDPSLRVRTATPTAMTVTHDDVIPFDATTFEVTVEEGIEGALCAISYEGAYLGSAFTDAAGHAIIDVVGELPAEQDEVTITVSAYNRFPYVGSAVVGQLYVPAVVLNPEYFILEIPMGGSANEILTIANTGEPGSILHFNLSIFVGKWVSVNPSSGDIPYGEDMEISVLIDMDGYLPDVYETDILVSSNAGDPIAVPIMVFVDTALDVAADAVPHTVFLAKNSPNPFNPSTTIGFGLPEDGLVRLDVFDVNGRLVANVANGTYTAGVHSLRWDGRSDAGAEVSSGVYYYTLKTAGATHTKRMVMLK